MSDKDKDRPPPNEKPPPPSQEGLVGTRSEVPKDRSTKTK
jgi:hypothetical protein